MKGGGQCGSFSRFLVEYKSQADRERSRRQGNKSTFYSLYITQCKKRSRPGYYQLVLLLDTDTAGTLFCSITFRQNVKGTSQFVQPGVEQHPQLQESILCFWIEAINTFDWFPSDSQMQNIVPSLVQKHFGKTRFCKNRLWLLVLLCPL